MISKGSPRHSNVAIFVPHAGCPHRCSFCNQCAISGQADMPTPGEVRAACETAISTMRSEAANAEIAFFGGSFTAIPQDIMISLLDSALPYLREGYFKGIRISTRPDAVDKPTLELLKDYGVTAVELGAQSMDDQVLAANLRGHTAAEVEQAAGLISESGLELGLQMMTGLYKSSDLQDTQTAYRLALLSPATIRIYPTLVMEKTALATLYQTGKYSPPTLEQSATLCAKLIRFFEIQEGIRVIRLGLHAGSDMQSGLIAGPWHPAFRELCEGILYYETALELLRSRLPEGGKATLMVNTRAVSRMVGQNRRNTLRLRELGYTVLVRGDSNIKPFTVKIFD